MATSGLRHGYQPARRLVPRARPPIQQGPSLFDAAPTRPMTLDERFALFHRENPAVYAEFVRLARQALLAGRDRIGAKMIAERIRWDLFIAHGDDGPKVNNSFVSRYARLVMSQEPDLAGIFKTRELRSA